VLGNLAVNGNAKVGSLLVQTNSATANTITIAANKTLAVTGAALVGSTTTGSTANLSVTGSTGSAMTIGGGLTLGVAATGSTTTSASFTGVNLTVNGAVNLAATTSATGVTSTLTVSGGSATFNLGSGAMNIATKSSTTTTGTIYSVGTVDLTGATSVN